MGSYSLPLYVPLKTLPLLSTTMKSVLSIIAEETPKACLKASCEWLILGLSIKLATPTFGGLAIEEKFDVSSRNVSFLILSESLNTSVSEITHLPQGGLQTFVILATGFIRFGWDRVSLRDDKIPYAISYSNIYSGAEFYNTHITGIEISCDFWLQSKLWEFA